MNDADTIGSMVLCGFAAWPPPPLILTLNMHIAVQAGPDREAMLPVGIVKSTCIPKIASASPRAPSFIMCDAPAPPSSAGWKSSLTVPFMSQKMQTYRNETLKKQPNEHKHLDADSDACTQLNRKLKEIQPKQSTAVPNGDS